MAGGFYYREVCPRLESRGYGWGTPSELWLT